MACMLEGGERVFHDSQDDGPPALDYDFHALQEERESGEKTPLNSLLHARSMGLAPVLLSRLQEKGSGSGSGSGSGGGSVGGSGSGGGSRLNLTTAPTAPSTADSEARVTFREEERRPFSSASSASTHSASAAANAHLSLSHSHYQQSAPTPITTVLDEYDEHAHTFDAAYDVYTSPADSPGYHNYSPGGGLGAGGSMGHIWDDDDTSFASGSSLTASVGPLVDRGGDRAAASLAAPTPGIRSLLSLPRSHSSMDVRGTSKAATSKASLVPLNFRKSPNSSDKYGTGGGSAGGRRDSSPPKTPNPKSPHTQEGSSSRSISKNSSFSKSSGGGGSGGVGGGVTADSSQQHFSDWTNRSLLNMRGGGSDTSGGGNTLNRGGEEEAAGGVD
ncbi:hypothetical protein B484DRAFT_392612, partial [Ochromonadaceae sp. CCMP2298]